MKIQDAHLRIKEGFAQAILLAEGSIGVYEDRIRELRASITIMRQCMADERLPGSTREADRQWLLSNGNGNGRVAESDPLRTAMQRSDTTADAEMTAAVAAAIGDGDNGSTVVRD